MSEAQRVHIVVTGRVQGVGFRHFVQKKASGLGLSGYVRNLPDGNVELEAEGPADQLDLLFVELRSGPPLSRVDDLKLSDRYVMNDQSQQFKIRY